MLMSSIELWVKSVSLPASWSLLRGLKTKAQFMMQHISWLFWSSYGHSVFPQSPKSYGAHLIAFVMWKQAAVVVSGWTKISSGTWATGGTVFTVVFSWIQMAKIIFLWRVAGLTPWNRVRSSVIRDSKYSHCSSDSKWATWYIFGIWSRCLPDTSQDRCFWHVSPGKGLGEDH